MGDTKKVAYVFPGQGAQTVGMGRDLYDSFPAARKVFELADQALGFPLSKLCFAGPEEELRQTINAQPAIVTVSLACLAAARDRLPPPAFLAGHSLGEYTALAAAGVLDEAATIRLARERGRLMHAAGQARPGSMVAILGLDEAALEAVCREAGVKLANINCPGQIVISGDKDRLEPATELARARGAARAVPLQVSGAFHSPLMAPAAQGLAETVNKLAYQKPAVPIIANTTAQPITTVADIKAELIRQLTSCIQWQRSVEYMVSQGVDTFIEVGPGKVLTGLIKRISKDVATVNIGDAAAVKGLDNQ